jgi:hypothetical protein
MRNKTLTQAERNRKKKALQSYFLKASKTEKSAKAALAATGIFTKTCKVSAKYGGQKAA